MNFFSPSFAAGLCTSYSPHARSFSQLFCTVHNRYECRKKTQSTEPNKLRTYGSQKSCVAAACVFFFLCVCGVYSSRRLSCVFCTELTVFRPETGNYLNLFVVPVQPEQSPLAMTSSEHFNIFRLFRYSTSYEELNVIGTGRWHSTAHHRNNSSNNNNNNTQFGHLAVTNTCCC